MAQEFRRFLADLQSVAPARVDIAEALTTFESAQFLSGIGRKENRSVMSHTGLKTMNVPLVERMSCRDSIRAGEWVLSYCRFEDVLLACECDAMKFVGPKAWFDIYERAQSAPCWAEERGAFNESIRERVAGAGIPECWMSDDSCCLDWQGASRSQVAEIGALRVAKQINRLIFHLFVTVYAVGKDRLPITGGLIECLNSGGIPCGWIGETEYSGYRSFERSLCCFHLGEGGLTVDHPWEPTEMHPKNSQMGRTVLRKKIA